MAKQQGPSPFDPRGLVAGFGAALQVIGSRKAAGVPVSELIQQTGHAFWSTTQAYYVPNKREFQVDGCIWGARYQAVTEIKRSQEFAIATNSIARELGEIRLVNTIMLGAIADRLPFSAEVLREKVLARFNRKGSAVVDKNAAAFDRGRAAAGT